MGGIKNYMMYKSFCTGFIENITSTI